MVLAHAHSSLPGLDEVVRTLTLRAGFNTTTVVVGTTLLGLAAGVVGVFAMLRKRSLVADALSHATLPGIALAFLLAPSLGLTGRSLGVLLTGGAISGVLGVLCIQGLVRGTRLGEDAAIGIVLGVFFGAGVVALSVVQRHAAAGAGGLDRFIYGQTAAMGVDDARLLGGIALAALLAAFLLLKELRLVCFDADFARVGGWPVGVIDLLLMGLMVLVTIAGLQAVGLLLVVAMLIIPAVAARFWTERLWVLVVLAGAFGAASGYAGSVLSALLPRKPAGAVIVLTAGGLFALSMLLAPARGVLAASVRGSRLRLRIACDHALEAAWRQSGEGQPALGAAALRALARTRGWSAWLGELVVLALRVRGLARVRGGALELTEAGVARGRRVARNHELWEQYLISHADVAPSHVDWSVDQVEHVLDERLVAELEAALRARGGGNAR